MLVKRRGRKIFRGVREDWKGLEQRPGTADHRASTGGAVPPPEAGPVLPVPKQVEIGNLELGLILSPCSGPQENT